MAQAMTANISRPTYRYTITRDVKVPMRDGVRLSANLFIPEGDGPFPVVFQRMPYGWSGYPLGEYFATRGYAFVIQDCRGRYDAEGEFYPFVNDARDGWDSLEWIAAQPWSTGDVGMCGPSYLGIVQLLLAPEGNPHLKAIVPQVMCGDFWKRGYWCDGAFSLALTAVWLGIEVTSRTGDMNLLPAYDLHALLSHLPLKTLDRAAGHESDIWRDFLAHAEPGEFWDRISITDKFDRITVPTLLIGGWYDYYAGEAFANFTGLRAHAPTEALRRAHKILIGPWSHLREKTSRLGDVDFGPEALADPNLPVLRWFDHYLKGLDNGVAEEPPVTIFVMGRNAWRQEAEWPPARARFTRYYFHGEGETLSTAPPGDEPPEHYRYDPANPVPTLGGNHSFCWPAGYHVIQPGPLDQRPVESRPDVLVYTTAPLEADTEVTGPVTVILYAATTAPDTDFTAKLVDVHPDGRAINLTEGIIRARFRESIRRPAKLLEPGVIYEYTIELQPTSHVFFAGHRIRVDLTSSNFPLWDRNPNTGHPQGMDAELRVAEQTVYHDGRYPSHILLPVMPDGSGDTAG